MSLRENPFASAANSEALADLRWILAQEGHGFFSFTADPSLQKATALRLAAQNAAVFDYSETEERSYSYWTLARWAERRPDQSVYLVINLQLVLAEKKDLFNLNLSRDELARHKKIWVFGLTREADDRLARHALDFYSFIRVKVSFEEAPRPEAENIQSTTQNDAFASHLEAQVFLQAYADMENKYLRLSVASDSHRQELLSASLTLTHIADVHMYLANYAQALRCYRKAQDIREKILGKDHPDTVYTYKNIARLRSFLGEGSADSA